MFLDLFSHIFKPVSGKTRLYFSFFFAMSNVRSQPICQLYQMGQIPYATAWQWQQQLVEARRQQSNLPDVLLLLEHPSVYTLGQGASLEFLKSDLTNLDVELYRVERGGEVTYHTPGQLVGYPILNLARHQKDLHWYLRQLEEVLIQTLAHWNVTAQRLPGLTGVWIGNHKVAAIGIKASRWITMHGFALNICPDLSGFQRIIPCGIADKPVGSLAQFIPGITRADVEPILVQQFARHFSLDLLVVDGIPC